MNTTLGTKIHIFKEVLNEHVSLNKPLHSGDLLRISQELDALIVDYYKQKKWISEDADCNFRHPQNTHT